MGEIYLKRICTLLLIMALVSGLTVRSAGEELKVYSYDFDLRFHLEAQDYPFRIREHMRGYEELADALEMKGNVSWCEETDSIDVNVDIIPVMNPTASIKFKLFGKSSCMCIESLLLGSDAYFLSDTFNILYFFRTVWKATGIPLPILSLFNPNITLRCLKNEVDAWNEVVPEIFDGQTITVEQIKKVQDLWRLQIQGDIWFQFWMDGFYALSPSREVVEDALRTLPDILMNVAGGEDLVVSMKENGVLSCENAVHEPVFEIKQETNSFSFAFSPIKVGTKYRPEFIWNENREENLRNVFLSAAWDKSDNSEVNMEGYDSLLKLQLEVKGIPESYPTDATVSIALSTGGYIFSDVGEDWEASLKMNSNGAVDLVVTKLAQVGEKDGQLQFRCYGFVKPTICDKVPSYKVEDLSVYTNLLVTTHDLASDLINSILPYLSKGIIDFVYELPVRACQSIMDDMESYGLLVTMLEGLQ